MEYKGYVGVVEYDEDERLLSGRVVGLKRDGIFFKAERADTIEEEFRKSVDFYLEQCAKRGQEPEKPYSGRILVRGTPDVHRRAVEAAARAGISLNEWIVGAIDRAAGEVAHG